ncbi:hypothetical protein GCM10010266_26400 [Streptomyces griseomycini]|nr:hypothetical protein GCM10010266_26400 [Streptomyces griseomycini]
MGITVCRAADVERLDRYIGSAGATSFHARRFARQRAGESTSPVAWLDGRPVGHAEVRWGGCADPGVRAARPGCPEINGLGVWPERLRSRGIGSALLRRAEAPARERGHTAVGLGVASGTPRARAPSTHGSATAPHRLPRPLDVPGRRRDPPRARRSVHLPGQGTARRGAGLTRGPARSGRNGRKPRRNEHPLRREERNDLTAVRKVAAFQQQRPTS